MSPIVMPARDFARLDFGAPSAKRSILGTGWQNTLSPPSHTNSGAKRITVGNRGAGKSAIFQVLAKARARRRKLPLKPGIWPLRRVNKRPVPQPDARA
jgi:hypothetical protein